MTPEEIEKERQALERLRACPDDREAFTDLYVLHRRAVLAFVHRKLGLPIEDDRVQDLAQECWVQALRGIASYTPQPGARFRTWLLTIVKRRCFDAFGAASTKAETTKRPLDEADGVARETDAGEFDPLDEPDLRRELQAAIAQLPAEQQEVLRLREEKVTFEEMHERTGAPLGTLKKRFALAMRTLRPILLRYHGREE
ncbi:MAG TPA: sigma-70 family RNA polymerase sigma factor [Planctomycetota bacterium]|nr:sigma-70 family RNA polymerase sigma factor [Planctomycetota bacterium]